MDVDCLPAPVLETVFASSNDFPTSSRRKVNPMMLLPSNRALTRAGFFALAALLAGCATLFNDSLKTVAMSSSPTEAEVWVDGHRLGTTPVSLDLTNHENHTVVFRKAGYKDVTCLLRANVDALWVVLDVIAGLVPIIVDAATGAWKGIEQGACNVVLPPDDGWQASDRAKLDARRAARVGWAIFG